MSKYLKYGLGVLLAVLLALNLITVYFLYTQYSRFNEIEHKTDLIMSNTNTISNKISNDMLALKEQQKDIMTPTELANYLKVDIKLIYKSIIDNPDSKFPCIKMNDEIRFSKKAVDEYMLSGNKTLE
ncbi:helix-turn-helix domain-containing protein [Clostridium sp. OS1-26]|uniref:helix-turn-helix domain-containing protein n=1 Tax=Clostridium sp. OS1-26 TaxID=3070681 RepID=UPI0027DFFBFC|nr:helix-turn-helix domain-containing protein [Clostridium sp. OS1-26]WML34216.1 helix-turn-helix domain-containing protein [Clostridium sp. OS1-26]